uniref:Uncharacterized protein n=1 Tax=Solanum lycopersicum TaxID=4081 RepID=A0A3Q7EYA8_SOLLC
MRPPPCFLSGCRMILKSPPIHQQLFLLLRSSILLQNANLSEEVKFCVYNTFIKLLMK